MPCPKGRFHNGKAEAPACWAAQSLGSTKAERKHDVVNELHSNQKSDVFLDKLM